MFESSKLKIERAKRHVSEANDIVTRFQRANTRAIVVEIDIKTGEEVVSMRLQEELPAVISAIVGDAIHNLRTALDLLAVDLVRVNAGNVNGVKFPFAQDINALEMQIRDKHIDRAAPDIVEMVRALKPYKGGNDALRTLHDLDVMDKHQTILVCAYWASATYRLRSRDFPSQPRGTGGSWMRFENGKGVMRFPAGSETKLYDDVECALQVVFDPAMPRRDEAIIPTLLKLVEIVDGVIQTFETHLKRSNIR